MQDYTFKTALAAIRKAKAVFAYAQFNDDCGMYIELKKTDAIKQVKKIMSEDGAALPFRLKVVDNKHAFIN